MSVKKRHDVISLFSVALSELVGGVLLAALQTQWLASLSQLLCSFSLG